MTKRHSSGSGPRAQQPGTPSSRLPHPAFTELEARAQALLEARELRRPVTTLLPLLQRCLAFHALTRGLGALEQPRSLWRAFRPLAFDCKPGQPRPWPRAQEAQGQELLEALLPWALEEPLGPLPAFGDHLREEARPVFLHTLWLHLDAHVCALDLGLLEGGLLARDPEDPAFAAQASLRQRAVGAAGALLPLADWLAAPGGRSMALQDALVTACALLDTLAEAVQEGFHAAGPRGTWLARVAPWSRPAYPYRAADLEALVARGGGQP